MLRQTQHIGIDIAKRDYVAAICQDGKFKTRKFSNDHEGHSQLVQWAKRLRQHDKIMFVMEASSTYGNNLAMFLHERAHPVAIVNPRPVKLFREALNHKNKTDDIDAQVIVAFADQVKPSPWRPKSVQVAELNGLIRRRQEVVKMISAEKCRFQTPGFIEFRVESVERHLEFLRSELKRLEKQIEDIFLQDSYLRDVRRVLTSIYGVGDIVAATFISVIGDVSWFDNKRQVVAFLGLNPANKQSGTSMNYSCMSKTGPPAMRSLLYLAAQTASREGAPFHQYKVEFMAGGKCYKQAMAALMRKLAGIMFALWKSGEMFSMQKYLEIKREYKNSA